MNLWNVEKKKKKVVKIKVEELKPKPVALTIYTSEMKRRLQEFCCQLVKF